MYKIAVVGSRDTVMGFRALGLSTFAAEDAKGRPLAVGAKSGGLYGLLSLVVECSGTAAKRIEVALLAKSALDESPFREIDQRLQLRGQRRSFNERRPVATHEQGTQLSRAEAVSVERVVFLNEIHECGQFLHEPDMERGRHKRLANRLCADRPKFKRAALGQVFELERPKPPDVLRRRHKRIRRVGSGRRFVVFGGDLRAAGVVAERQRCEVQVLLPSFDAVEARRFEIAHDIVKRPEHDTVHAAVVRVEPM